MKERISLKKYAEAIKKLGYSVALANNEKVVVFGNDKGAADLHIIDNCGEVIFYFSCLRNIYSHEHYSEIKISSPEDITKEVIEKSLELPEWVKKIGYDRYKDDFSISFNEAMKRFEFKRL